MPIPKAPNGEERQWQQWIVRVEDAVHDANSQQDTCQPETPPSWKEIEPALRLLVKTLMSGNLVMLRVLPLHAPQQMVWFTWMQFLEGAYA